MKYKKFFSKLDKRRVFLFGAIVLFILLAQAWLVFQLRSGNREAEAQVLVVGSVVPSVAPTPSEVPVISPNVKVNVPILMYHHIEPVARSEGDPVRALGISKDRFDEQMNYLKNGGYIVIGLADLYRKIATRESTEKNVVLTFDDGYIDNFEVAWPIMQKYGFKGTFFIISNRIGTSDYMSNEQIKTLQDSGCEIGSHTQTHPDLTKLSISRLKEEIEGSKASIGEIIGQEIISFCYPAGRFNSQVENEVRSAGYQIAVTTSRWRPFSTDDLLAVSRIRMSESTNIENLIRY